MSGGPPPLRGTQCSGLPHVVDTLDDIRCIRSGGGPDVAGRNR